MKNQYSPCRHLFIFHFFLFSIFLIFSVIWNKVLCITAGLFYFIVFKFLIKRFLVFANSLHIWLIRMMLLASVQCVQSLSHVRLFATPWSQASLSITNFRSSPRLTSIQSVMLSSHVILCRPLLLLPPIPPSIRVFPNESTLRMRWPKYWSFLASFLPKKSQGWSPSEWTGWISLQSKGLSRVFSNTTVQKHQFFSAQLSSQSNSHIHTWPLEKPYPWLDRPLLAK